MKQLFLTILAVLALESSLFAAVGCDLNDPDKDVKRLFPGSTGYKTEYVSISQKGGDSLLARIEQRLGDRFQGLFETGDVPYTMYRVFRKKELAGYIHGVNQKGTYGGIQVFLALDTAGVIKTLYFQKLTSKAGHGHGERLRQDHGHQEPLRGRGFGLQVRPAGGEEEPDTG
jgi:hypothetical protein